MFLSNIYALACFALSMVWNPSDKTCLFTLCSPDAALLELTACSMRYSVHGDTAEIVLCRESFHTRPNEKRERTNLDTAVDLRWGSARDSKLTRQAQQSGRSLYAV